MDSLVYYKKNLAAIKTVNPKLAIEIEQTIIPDNYKIETTKSGFPNIVIKRPGGDFYYHSKYDPEKEAFRYVEAILKNDEETISKSVFFVILGLGIGYFLYNFVKKIDWIKGLVVVEPDTAILKLAFYKRDFSEFILQKIFTIVTGEITQKKLMVPVLNDIHYAETAVIYSPNSLTLYSEGKNLQKYVIRIMSEKICSINTFVNSGKHLLKNYYELIPEFVVTPPLSHLVVSDRNIPVVCVAAGPSLSENMDVLKEICGKAVLICVDSAFKVLLDNGIKPDIVTAFDPLHHKYMPLIESDIDMSSTLLVYGANVYSDFVKFWKGPKYLYRIATGNYIDEVIYPGEPVQETAQTVAIANLIIASKISDSNIFLFGQDLCYDKFTHAGGATLRGKVLDVYNKDGHTFLRRDYVSYKGHVDEIGYGLDEKVVPVLCNDGKERFSPIPFSLYVERFSFLIKEVVKNNVYNISERGAVLGTANVIATEELKHIFKTYESKEITFDCSSYDNKDAVKNYLVYLRQDIDTVNSKIMKKLKEYHEFTDENIFKRYVAMSFIIEQIYKDFPQLTSMLSHFIPHLVELHNKAKYKRVENESEDAESRRCLFALLKIYIGLKKACAKLDQKLKIALMELES